MVTADILLVLTTCESAAAADATAEAIVSAGLAACVNAVSGVTSTYRWRGKVERSAETLLIIKTTAARYGEVEAAIQAHSTYELPEVVAVPLAAGSAPYLAWIAAQTVQA
jgi:periplasmic divalent cation tolerance protein